jgi:SAM-dependent methyltransferase
MKIPLEIRQKYLTKKDPEAEFFLDYFAEDPNDSPRVLEVGANDNKLATMLIKSNFEVVSTDLKEYEGKENNNFWEHLHFVGDFCDQKWFKESLKIECLGYLQPFDLIYSVSAIEHFGLGAYGEGFYKPYYDVIACRYIYDLLKPGGVAYISVPYGGRFVEYGNHWRVYSDSELRGRIVQDFKVEWTRFRVVEWNLPNCGQEPSQSYIQSLVNGEPYVSVLLKLRKGKTNG